MDTSGQTHGHEIDFAVEGMTCAACARRVEKALVKVAGVREARVDLVRERAVLVVEGPDERVGAEAQSAVERAGYVLVRKERGAAPSQAKGRAEQRTWAAWGLTGLALWAGWVGLPWLELAIASLAVLGAGGPIFVKAFADIRARTAGMDVLVAVGTAAALSASVLTLVAPALGAHGHGAADGAGHAAGHGAMAHSDASMAALIIAVVLLGKRLERGAKARATDAIEAIVRAMPESARVVRHGVEAELAVAEVRAGDEVHVAPFARVPVDGVLLAASAEEPGGVQAHGDPTWALDESVVTGESRPVERAVGARVLGGSVNLGRALRLRAEVSGEGSELAKVIAAVSRAAADKSPIVRTTDRVAAVFAPVVLLAAATTLVGWLLAGAAPLEALRLAIAVVVVACPCALGLATPVAVTVAVGRLASRGVLVRDAAVLEVLPHVRTLVLDKTGTLTVGAPRVVARVRATDSLHEDALVLAHAASVESDSHHPLARAIFEEAMRVGLAVPRATDVEEIPGQGMVGQVERRRVEVVRPDAAHDAVFVAPASVEDASVVEVRLEGVPVERLYLEDALREEAAAVIATLRARGITPVIRSGDAPRAVAHVARALGIEDARGGLRPEDKLADLDALARPVAMIGDGLNDAPALARADVGLAIGSRTETALRAAGVALPQPDLRLVVETHDVARRCARIVRENLALAFAYNTLSIPFAAFGAFDRIGGPAAAAIAMAASSLLVVLNALRLGSGSGVSSPA